MFVQFKKVTIEGFQSIGKVVTLELDSQGFVSVKGINEYEKKALSNGSGKSTIFEAINWCLFGKTSSGVSDVKNLYYSNGCVVTVTFILDGVPYKISRSLGHKTYKNQVQFLCHDNDWSCRNKTDTDKRIRSTLPFSQDIFLSTIFLSQGFTGRLSSLTPSARKERLEILANIDESINSFKESLTEIKNTYATKSQDITKNVSYIEGKLDLFKSEKQEIDQLQATTDLDIPDINIEDLRTKLQTVKAKLTELQDQKTTMVLERTKIDSNRCQHESKVNQLKRDRNSVQANLDLLEKECVCPTCKQTLTQDKNNELKVGYQSQIKTLDSEIQSSSNSIHALTEQYETITSKIESMHKTINTLTTMQNKNESIVNEYDRNIQANADRRLKISRLSTCVENIASLSSDITKLQKLLETTNVSLDTTSHMLAMLTKEFRTYLLSTVINQMNVKLAEYSRYLFTNESETIKIDADDTKLNIYLGESKYESLSGGEKKKVDLALVLAQRNIALRLSGFQCNILILDEILENCDEQASNVALNLLNQASEDVGSIFVISHNNYSIPVDMTITVTKGSDRCSKISIN